ncbi:MAG: CBS domain-containing protein [Gemmatimonadota bacterium]
MQVKDMMTASPRCCDPDDAADAALTHMDEVECGAVPVVDADRRVVGIVTDRDILFGIRSNGGSLAGLTIAQCMTANPLTVGAEEDGDDVIRSLAARRVRRAPVVDADGRLVGIVAQADVAVHVQDDGLVAAYLREISAAAPSEPAAER